MNKITPIGILPDDVEFLIRASVSENTLRAYRRILRDLSAWLDGKAINDALLSQYISFLHEGGKSPSSISQVVAAVKWRGKFKGVPVVGEITKGALAGIRREGRGRGRGQADGLDWESVDEICRLAESEKAVAGFRDSAMIRLMSDCLLRVSEAVAVNVEDLNLNENTLTIPESKTDQEAVGEILHIGDATCAAIENYCVAAEISKGAVFRRVYQNGVGSECLSTRGATDAIKRRAKAAGVEGLISGHSLRIGSAMSLAKAGASVVEMQTAGRWKSPNMPAHYAKAELAAHGPIARYKYGKKGGD